MRARFHTTIEEKLKTGIQVKAIQEGRNVNDILEELIENYLRSDKENCVECNTED